MGKVLEIYKIFEKHFGEEEAKTLTEAVEELVKEQSLNLKTNLKEELKEELATKQDLQILESKLTAEIQKTKNDLLKWLIVLFIGQATFIVGLVFTLIKALKG
ncbi:MAG TPA: hypothetical protein EYN34_03160 [Aquifex sp.]|nr:hypothetical protein [Aquifex sp.]